MRSRKKHALFLVAAMRQGQRDGDGLLAGYIRMAAEEANVSLEEIGTNEEELKQFQRNCEKKHAQESLQLARELRLQSDHFHCIARHAKDAGLTLEEIGTSEGELETLLKKKIAHDWECSAQRNMSAGQWATFCSLKADMESPEVIPQLIQKYRGLPNQYFRLYVWELISLLRKKFPTDVRLLDFLQQEAGDHTFGKAALRVLEGQEMEVRNIEGTPYGLTDGVSLCPKKKT